MILFRNADDEANELAQEDADKEIDLLTQARDEAARWKAAYKEQFKRAEALEKQLKSALSPRTR